MLTNGSLACMEISIPYTVRMATVWIILDKQQKLFDMFCILCIFLSNIFCILCTIWHILQIIMIYISYLVLLYCRELSEHPWRLAEHQWRLVNESRELVSCGLDDPDKSKLPDVIQTKANCLLQTKANCLYHPDKSKQPTQAMKVIQQGPWDCIIIAEESVESFARAFYCKHREFFNVVYDHWPPITAPNRHCLEISQ